MADTVDDPHRDARAAAVRAMAQQAVIAGLVRLHPEPQKLRDLIDEFAEANRAILLASPFPDEQLEKFEKALRQLLHTLPPPSPTSHLFPS